MKKYIVGITGASGSIYAYSLISTLLKLNFEVFIIATKPAIEVMSFELEMPFEEILKDFSKISNNYHIESIDNYFSKIASGSHKTNGMVITPCTMGTIGRISNGSSDNLLIRTADVCLKEKRPLVITPRESPLNCIHLENMLKLSQSGAVIMPISPSFYHKPKSIQDIVDYQIGRILDLLGIDYDIIQRWEGNK